ncbi:serpentine receptor, putative [Plasmodium ovale wallikeri]|uniref:Serpentine receptor, putative n=1 Tax=Plasmodium ovale wallikeri TaxID=864142 RepID=A0A1A8ZXA9_PLAOA|nr:serpentine receptor, putative [Plasmodium ovale wallikeri]SBT48965.1 serpentine receptor, putative [Plasmodium ovale wallikeri]
MSKECSDDGKYANAGLYIFGKDDTPFVLLGEKNDMKLKEAHAIFENVGISTTDNKNTKYFSFDMEEKEDKKGDDSKKKEENETYRNDAHISNASNHDREEEDEDEEGGEKEKFKIHLYKDNPYLRKKKEYRYEVEEESNVTPDLFLELIIMRESDFNTFYLPKDSDVCCQMETEGIDGNQSYTCPGKGYLKRYVDESNIYSLKLPVYFINDRIHNNDISTSPNEINNEQLLTKIKNTYVYNISKTDVYALFLSNCLDSKKFELELHGNIHILNKYGYLPGDKISKLNLYVFLMLIYFGYLLLWIYMLVKNKQYVIKIQIWILVFYRYALNRC